MGSARGEFMQGVVEGGEKERGLSELAALSVGPFTFSGLFDPCE